jgi:hypothetical protein
VNGGQGAPGAAGRDGAWTHGRAVTTQPPDLRPASRRSSRDQPAPERHRATPQDGCATEVYERLRCHNERLRVSGRIKSFFVAQIIDIPSKKCIGERVGDLPKDEAEQLIKCPTCRRLDRLSGSYAKCSLITGRYRTRPRIRHNENDTRRAVPNPSRRQEALVLPQEGRCDAVRRIPVAKTAQ